MTLGDTQYLLALKVGDLLVIGEVTYGQLEEFARWVIPCPL